MKRIRCSGVFNATEKERPSVETKTAESNGNANAFDQWCVLDLFGHQRTAGHVTEATIGGCSFLRIDVPERDGSYRTEYYGNGAIYSMRPVAEQLAREIALRAAPPVSAWDIQRLGLNPKPEQATESDDGSDSDDDDEFG